MRNLISAASIAALLAAASLAGVHSAQAGASSVNFDKQNQYINTYCGKFRGADQCNDWRAGHANWTSEQYRNFYRRHKNDKEFATREAAALFGADLGAPEAAQDSND